jgi:hypothetical protein
MDPTSPKTIEEAAYLLSQRHASRADDEVVIWNLLTGGPEHKDTVTLWKSQTHVRTGFLISSADRIQGSAGFSWAPRSPYVRPQRRSVALDGGKEQIYTIRFPIVRRDGKLLRTYHGGRFARQVAGHGYKLRSFGIILR